MHYSNKEYLNSSITFTDDNRLLDFQGNCIMMGWEDPIMKDAANLICKDGGKILNVGFGLGIIDNYIQSHNVKEHWIIEAHPQVQFKMTEEGWDKKENVTLIFDDWRNVLNELPKFDGIYFDSWVDNNEEFKKHLDNILNPKGKFIQFCMSNPNLLKKKYNVEEHKTKLKNIDRNQLLDGMVYWDPSKTEFIHHLIIKK